MLRFSVESTSDWRADEEPIDAGLALELLTSELWDLGTDGISELGDGQIMAGFGTEPEARAAAKAIAERLEAFCVADTAVRVQPAATVAEWGDGSIHTLTINWPNLTADLSIRADGAFGHGAHPTTRLVLEQMKNALSAEGGGGTGGFSSRAVLDVGTGTGVLAIAAATAGAAVVAVDNDPASVAVARENAARNEVRVDCRQATIGEVMSERSTPFDLIVINVLLPVHRLLSTEVRSALAPDGVIIASGYLGDQAEELVDLYRGSQARSTVDVEAIETDGDWSSHRFRSVPA